MQSQIAYTEQLLRDNQAAVAGLLAQYGVDPNGFDIETVAYAAKAMPDFGNDLLGLLGMSNYGGMMGAGAMAATGKAQETVDTKKKKTETMQKAGEIAAALGAVASGFFKNRNAAAGPAPEPIAPVVDEKKVPMWMWIGGGLVVLLIVIAVVMKMQKKG